MNIQNKDMIGISILGTGRSLPARIVTNDDMSRMVETDDEWIRTRTGIGQRYICEDETSNSLACEAAKKALQKAGKMDAGVENEIGAVVVATTTPRYAFPSVACMVKEYLGLPEDVMSFDISAACSGFLYGLEIMRGILATGRKKYGILIGSEAMSKITDFTDRSTCVLFGDGAAAMVVALDDSMYCHFAWSRGNADVLYCNGVGSDEMHIHMEGNQVFRFAVSVIDSSIKRILEEKDLTMDDIDYVVCHQANERIIDHVSKKYAGNEHKFYKNMEQYANTSAASIPIAMDEMFEKGMLAKGQKVICVGFGAGLTWSSVLLTI